MMSSDTENQVLAGGGATVVELRDQALADPENFVKHMRHFRDVKNAPFRTSWAELPDALGFVVFCQFASIPQPVNRQVNLDFHRLFSRGEVFKTMVADQEKNLLIAAETQIGTHTAKIPNPAVEEPSALFANGGVFKAASHSRFVSTATIKSSQRIGAAGNAAQGKAQRLLATRLEIDGEFVDVVNDIARKGPIWNALNQIGFSGVTLNALTETISERLSSAKVFATVGKGTKQLIWPTGDGDVAITPVHPYAMHVELSRRLEKRRVAGAEIKKTFTVVGGSQPQNAGLVNGDMGGRHQLLLGSPPTIESFENRSVYRDAYRGEIDFAKPGSEAIRQLAKILKATHRDNRESRAALGAAIRQVIVGIAMPFIRFRDATWHDDINPEKVTYPKWAAALLGQGYENVGERKGRLIEDVVNQVFRSIDDGLLGAGDDANDLRTVVAKVADEFFTDVFKGDGK
jgi:hypothetical protein